MAGSDEAGIGWIRLRMANHPLLIAALLAVICVVLSDFLAWVGLLAGLLAGVLAGRYCGWRAGCCWGMSGLLAAGMFVHRETQWEKAQRCMLEIPGGELRARITEDARGSERFWLAPARIIEGPGSGHKVWWEGRGPVPVSGCVVQARGNFLPLPAPRNPGEFDRAAWLRRQGIAAVFHAARFDHELEIPSAAAKGAAIRHGFRERVTAGLEDDSQQARIIRAMVIGEPPPDSHALVSAFRLSGTLHVFSVSGLHVGMVGGIGWLLLGWAGVPRRLAVVVLLPLMFGYAWITGHGAPAVRAAWMAAVFLGAFVFRRKPDLLNALGAVLLATTLWDGRLLFQPGVQLSYGVVAAIAIGASWAGRRLKWMTTVEPHLPGSMRNRWQERWLRFRKHVAGSIAVSLAAGAGSTPLTGIHFGIVTPVSVLANLPLVPMVFCVLAMALVSTGISFVVPPVSHGINKLNGVLANGCAAVAGGFASLPGGHFTIRRQKEPALVVFDLNYGAGAACLGDGAGHGVLLDCGDKRGFKHQVAPSLRWMGIEPDAVVISHPDGGHLGGAKQVWEAFPIRQALMPVKLSRSPTYRSWLEDGPRAGIRLLDTEMGMRFPLVDGAVLEVLHSPDPLAVNSLADERMMVSRVEWRGWKFLFTGDAGVGTEGRMLRSGRDLTADVIVAGNHRSDLSLGDDFLTAVSPRVIIASNPSHPIEDRRNPETIAYWRSRGIRVVDQAESGGVTLRVDEEGKLHIEGFLGSPRWRIGRE